MLQVAVIQEVPGPLFLPILLGKSQGQLLETFYQRGCLGGLPGTVLPAGGKVFSQFLGRPLGLLPKSFQSLLQGIPIVTTQSAPASGGKSRHRLAKTVPVTSGGQFSHGHESLTVLFQSRGIGPLHRQVFPALLQGPGQQADTVVNPLLGIFQNHPLPGGRTALLFLREVHGHLFRKPLLREGMTLHEAVQGQHHFHQPAVVPLPGEGVRQPSHGARLEGLLQHFVQSGIYQLFLLLVGNDLEVRRNVQQMEKLPDHLGAEAVHRADMCLGKQNALPPQVGIPRGLPQHVVEPLFQAGTHLRGSRLGKGDDEHPVRRGRIFRVRQPFDGPLH
ncbi:unknown [Clostridium sp. CAG:1013]|nr:unknown [Clostridium sp. CAG:1013]